MTTPADNKMNEPIDQPPTDCQKRMTVVMEELQKSLDAARGLTVATTVDERESIEADICLASRSAYFDFYTWVVLNGVIDEPAERALDQQFRQAVSMMQPGRFRKSVEARYEEFRKKCRQVRSGTIASSTSGVFDDSSAATS